ncbi:MAG TPA: response regulator [Candidatus Paceibacterota bacterium]|nr:response regulator [Candidatus Paceibacterota bacterium]
MEKVPLILIVDDEPSFAEIFSIKLNTAGFRVEIATNGELGVRKAKEIKPDLVLMDVQMPVMNGVEAIQALRNDPETKDQKVVFLTNMGDSLPGGLEADQRGASDMGALGYIRKTDDLDNLLTTIKGYLGGH